MPQGELTPSQGFNPKGQVILQSKNASNRFIKPKFFKVDEDKMAIEQGELPDKTTSWLGTPVYDMVVFDSITYEDPDAKISESAALQGGKGTPKRTLAKLELETCLIELNKTKNIVTTAVQGRNGTVKEYISDGDFQISITGVLTSKYNNVPPRELISLLHDFCRANKAIPISSNFLNYFEIYQAVITDLTINQIEGARNTVSVSINLLSDTPFEIKYNGVDKFLG